MKIRFWNPLGFPLVDRWHIKISPKAECLVCNAIIFGLITATSITLLVLCLIPGGLSLWCLAVGALLASQGDDIGVSLSIAYLFCAVVAWFTPLSGFFLGLLGFMPIFAAIVPTFMPISEEQR